MFEIGHIAIIDSEKRMVFHFIKIKKIWIHSYMERNSNIEIKLYLYALAAIVDLLFFSNSCIKMFTLRFKTFFLFLHIFRKCGSASLLLNLQINA